MRNTDFEELKEIVKKTGEKAREEAKLHGTAIIYTDKEGRTIKEYADGRVELKKG